jgi:hypothetical protein
MKNFFFNSSVVHVYSLRTPCEIMSKGIGIIIETGKIIKTKYWIV